MSSSSKGKAKGTNTGKGAEAAEARTSSVLPAPQPLIDHHLQTLAPLLRSWASSGKVPPVLLLTGPSGVGKRTLAYWLAQWLTCEARPGALKPEAAGSSSDEGDLFGGLLAAAPAAPSPTEDAAPPADPAQPADRITDEPCGACPSCRKAVSGAWVDFAEIGPESDGDSARAGSIKIDQFRRLKESLGFRAYSGGYRVTLVRDADRMTVQAANSTLKLLEEPPPGWVLILTASDPTLLLPTLVSRCQRLRLRPIPAPTLAELMAASGVPQERQAVCAASAQGSWGRALRLASDEAWERRQSVIRFLQAPAPELNALVDWAASDPAFFELLTDQLEGLTAELVEWGASPAEGAYPGAEGAYTWKSADAGRTLATHATRAARLLGSREAACRFWIERADRLARARTEQLAPLNRKLLIQDLLIPWLAVS